jgi:hypothetical protein
VQNKSTHPIFVTVVRIGRDGVEPLYPMGDDVSFRVKPNGPPSPIPGVYRMTEPYGTDVYKVIATREPANFSGLLFRRRLPVGLVGRGPAEAKDASVIAELPANVHPLARLLREAADGSKGVKRDIVGTEWATAEKSIQVLPPNPPKE